MNMKRVTRSRSGRMFAAVVLAVAVAIPLGMTGAGEASAGGHGLHMRAINQVRAAGSVAAAVERDMWARYGL